MLLSGLDSADFAGAASFGVGGGGLKYLVVEGDASVLGDIESGFVLGVFNGVIGYVPALILFHSFHLSTGEAIAVFPVLLVLH